MSNFASIGGSILAFNLLILVHELGHYIFARATGMTVHRFSIGFGPPVLQIKGKTTTFQLALFPIGGFVQVAGMSRRAGDAYDRGGYLASPLWARALMVGAGPVFNWLAAVVIFWGMLLSGNMLFRPTPVVDEVQAEGPAAAAGLLPGDTIVRIDDAPVADFADIRDATGKSGGATLRVAVIRPPEGVEVPLVEERSEEMIDGAVARVPRPDPAWEERTFEVTPARKGNGWLIGVTPRHSRVGIDRPLGAFSAAWVLTWQYTVGMTRALGEIVTGKREAQLSSVVKITEYGADAIKTGFEDRFLQFLALLSLNLFLLNLLPVAPLDGGRLLFIAVEAVARRPVPLRVEMLANGVGFALLMGLFLVVTAGDVASYF